MTKMLLGSIDNFPPNITAKNSFTVMVGQNNVFNFRVEDIDSNITVGLVRGLPTGASIVSNGGSQYSVHYRPTVVTNNETLTIIATDPHSASSTITPRLYLCACANGGSCNLEGLPSSDAKTVIMNCACSQGNYSRSTCYTRCQSVLQPILVDIVRRIVMVVQLYSAMWNQAVVMYQLLEWGLSVDRVLLGLLEMEASV